ncbi:putative quinol monooxygenase [Sinomonas atrocyanea]
MPVFIPSPDRAGELRTALHELQQTSRKDPGCIEYSVYEADGRFVLIEGWDSRADLESHNEQAHVQEFVGSSADLLAEPFTVARITPVS